MNDLSQEKSLRRGRQAISHEEIRAFLNSVGLDFPEIDKEPSKPIANIDQYVHAAASSSVFQIAIVGRVARLSWSDRISEVRGIKTKDGWDAFEDRWCMRCNGNGQVACPERGCVGGWCSHRERYVSGSFATGEPIYSSRVVKTRCKRCGASGKLTCQHCRGAREEPSL